MHFAGAKEDTEGEKLIPPLEKGDRGGFSKKYFHFPQKPRHTLMNKPGSVNVKVFMGH